jgi:hypothetical protein
MMMSPAFEENRIHPDLGPLIVKQPLTPSSCASFGLLSRAKLSLTQAVNLRFKRAEPAAPVGPPALLCRAATQPTGPGRKTPA